MKALMIFTLLSFLSYEASSQCTVGTPYASITPDPAVTCASENLIFNGNPITGTTPYSHSWTGTGAAYLNNTAIQTPVFSGAAAGTYTLTYLVTDNGGCTGGCTFPNNTFYTSVLSGSHTAENTNNELQQNSGGSPTWGTAADGWLFVGKGKILWVSDFNITGSEGSVTACNLKTKYSVEAGYSGNNSVRYNNGAGFQNTTIIPFDGESNIEGSFNLFAVGVDTWAEITALDIDFNNNDGAGPSGVSFDYIWLDVTYESGCRITVTVKGNPTAGITPDPAEACESVTLTMNGNPAGGSGTYTTHAWTGTGAASLTATNVQSPNFTNGTNGNYTLTYTVTDDNGCTGNDQLVVTINDNPASSVIPNPMSLCSGAILTVDGNPSGGSGIYSTHAWTGTGSGSLSSTAVQIPDFTGGAEATYTLTYTVTDNKGCSGSDEMVVTVENLTATINPDPASMCLGSFINFSTIPSGGTTPYTHSWTGTGNSYLNNSTIQTPLFSGAGAGNYTLTYTVTDTEGCWGTDAIVLTVTSDPIPTPSILPDPFEVCEGITVSVDGNPSGGSGTYTTHKWTGTGAASLTATNVKVPNFTNVTNGSYTLTYTVTDDVGCVGTDDITLTVDDNPSPTIIPDPFSMCAGVTLSVDGNPSGGSGVYSTHAWTGTGAASLTATNVQIPNFSNGVEGNYTLTYTVTDDKGCVGSDEIVASVSNVAASISPASPSICVNAPMSFDGNPSAGTTPYSHAWTGTGNIYLNNTAIQNPTFTGPTNGTYNLKYTVTDNEGCSASNGVVVTVNNNPVAAILPYPAEGCAGVTKTVNGNPSGGSMVYISHAWTGTGAASLSSTTLQVPDFTNGSSGTYTLTYTITDNRSCTGSDEITLTVNNNPSSAIIPDPLSLCTGVSNSVNGSPSGGTTPYAHAWTGTGAASLTATNIQIPNFSNGVPGNYTLTYTVTDTKGCVSTDKIVVTVANVSAAITPNPFTAYLNVATTVDGNPVGGSGVYTHAWKGTGVAYLSATNVKTPNFTGTVAGNYTLTYTVNDDAGCSFVNNLTVTVTNMYITIANGNWSTSGTWLGGTVPNGATQNATVRHTVVQTQNALQVNNLIIDAVGSLDLDRKDITVNGTTTLNGYLLDGADQGINTFIGKVTVGSGGSFSTANASTFEFRGGLENNGSSFNKTGTGAVTFGTNSQSITNNNAAAMVLNSTIALNSTINITGTGPITLGNGSNVTIAAGIKVTNTNSGGVTISGVLNGTDASSEWINGTNGKLIYNNATDPMATGLFTASASGNTVNFTFNGAQNIKVPTSSIYHNLTLSTAGIKLLQGNLTINGALTISGTATMQFGTPGRTVAVLGNLSGGTIDLTSAVHTLNIGGATNSAIFTTDANASIINYNRAGDQTVISSPNYRMLTISGSGNKTIQGNITVNNNLTLSGGVLVYDVSAARTITVTGNLNGASGAINMSGGAQTHILNLNGATNTLGTLTTTSAGSTVNYNLAGDQSVFGSTNYRNLVLTGSGNKTVQGNISTGVDLTVTGCTMLFGATARTVSVTGTFSGSGTVDMTSAAHTLNLGGASNSITTFTTDANASTVNYNGTIDQSIFPHTGYRNLTISGSGTKTLGGDVTVNNTLSLSGGTMDVSASLYNVTLIGNLSNTGGTFSPRTGTFTFNGTTVVSGTGTTTLYNATINSAKTATINAAAKITVDGTLTLNDAECLVIKSNGTTANTTGSLITNGSIAGAGTAKVERYVTGNPVMADIKSWYISSPVSNKQFNTITNTHGIYRWEASLPTPAWSVNLASDAANFEVMRGYVSRYTVTAVQNFSGTLNTGTLSVPVYNSNWNLVGNPYPSAIDWDAVSGWTKTDLLNSVYIVTDPLVATYNGDSKTGVNGGSRYIQVGQGFYVYSNTGSPVFQMTNAVRVHNGVEFLKRGTTDSRDIIRITAKTNDSEDEIAIGFDENAKDSLDRFDSGKKFLKNGKNVEIYSILPTGHRTAINFYETFDKERIIPLGYIAEGIQANTKCSFTANLSEYNKFYDVKLYDKLEEREQNLSINPIYNFTTAGTVENDRFYILFGKYTSIAEKILNNNNIEISFVNGGLIIEGEEKLIQDAMLSVYDITGRKIISRKIQNTGIQDISLPEMTQTYIVNVRGSKVNKTVKVFNK